jgi:hypothetical protein
MMAKMFYTMEEATTALAKSEEEVKQYAREGRLREFRDGPRLMFKADQVEQLKTELTSGGGAPDLGVSDSGGLIGLVDTTGASGTSITLSEADTGQSSVAGLGGLGTGSGSGLRLSGSASGINLAQSGAGMSGAGMSGMGASGTGLGMSPGASGIGLSLKGDTGLAADLGMSGSLGGVPSPGRLSAGTMAGSVAGTQAGRAGINVFGPDDDATADPGAQTAISGGIREQVNLEGVGSGSGLLDLTRESDDTSLGAVLDEITPGATVRKPGMADTGAGTGISGLTDEAPARRATGAPIYTTAPDPMAPAFGGLALGGFAVLLYGMFVLVSALVGAYPGATSYFKNTAFYMPAVYGLGIAIVFFVIGMLMGKVARR